MSACFTVAVVDVVAVIVVVAWSTVVVFVVFYVTGSCDS